MYEGETRKAIFNICLILFDFPRFQTVNPDTVRNPLALHESIHIHSHRRVSTKLGPRTETRPLPSH